MKVGAVNADEHKGLGGQYGVQGFPTIKFFGADKYKPLDYQSKSFTFDVICWDVVSINHRLTFFSKILTILSSLEDPSKKKKKKKKIKLYHLYVQQTYRYLPFDITTKHIINE